MGRHLKNFGVMFPSPTDMVEDCESEASDDGVSFEAMQFIDPSELEVGEEIAEGVKHKYFALCGIGVHERALPVVAKRLKFQVPS